MKIRAVAAAALALALGVGLTGCNMISPQRTQMEYAASDGINVDLGSIAVRNALLIVDTDTAEASQANLVAGIVNRTTEDAQVTVALEGASPVQLSVPAQGDSNLVQFGFGDAGPEFVSGSFTSGTTVEATFTAVYTDREGNQQTVEETRLVPVLGADDPANVLIEYQTLAPGGEGDATDPAGTVPAETGAVEDGTGAEDGTDGTTEDATTDGTAEEETTE